MRRVNLKQVANHLGLTEGTVSRALNNYPDITQSTREKVQAAADALGYRPNPMARRLATGRAETIAFLMPTGRDTLASTFVSLLLQGLGDALSAKGWDLLVVQPCSGEDETETLRKLIASGRVAGVVLSRPLKVDPRIEFLKKANFPFVVHGRAKQADGYAWYDIDSHSAFAQAVDHLVGLGHQRIGFIGAPTYLNFAQQRLEGYQAGLKRNNLAYCQTRVAIAELTDEGGEKAALDLISQKNPPTALLCSNDIQAIGALAAIRNHGLVAGKDISVIGYDGVWMGRHTNPPLTTMAQPQAHSGQALGDMLLSIIDGGAPDNFQVLRRAELVQRKSDGPAPSMDQKVIDIRKREDTL